MRSRLQVYAVFYSVSIEVYVDFIDFKGCKLLLDLIDIKERQVVPLEVLGPAKTHSPLLQCPLSITEVLVRRRAV